MINNELGKDGKPVDKEYLERGLPPYMQKDLDELKVYIAKKDGPHWDLWASELNSDLNGMG